MALGTPTPLAPKNPGSISAPSPISPGAPGMEQGVDWNQFGAATQASQQITNQYAQAQGQAYAGNPGMQQALQFFGVNAGPQLAALAMKGGNIGGEIGNNAANLAMQTRFLNANVGLDKEQLAQQQGANSRAQAQNPALQDILDQLFGIGAKSDAESLDQKQRAIKSDNANRGSFNTPGYGLSMGDAQNGYDNSRATAEQNRRRDQINLDEQKAGLADKAKSLGLSLKGLDNTLEQGLAKLGIDHMMNYNQLKDAMFSNDMETAAAAQQIYRQALDYSGYFDTMDPGRPAPVQTDTYAPQTKADPATGVKTTAPVPSTAQSAVNSARQSMTPKFR